MDESGIPHVGADEDAGAPWRRGREGVDAVAGGKVLAVLEPPIGREIDLAVQEDERAILDAVALNLDTLINRANWYSVRLNA